MATVRGFAGGNSDRTDGLDMSGWFDAVPHVLVFLPGHVNYDPETGTYDIWVTLPDGTRTLEGSITAAPA